MMQRAKELDTGFRRYDHVSVTPANAGVQLNIGYSSQ